MDNQKFDVAVVGGGASGMMAAIRAAELGAKTVLIEKNDTLGKKLLMTGGGRCNITNIELAPENLADKIGRNGKFLFSSLRAFGPEETIEFFKEKKLKTKVEDNGRVFPKSDKAQDVLDVLMKYLRENKVELVQGEEVLGFDAKDGQIESVKLRSKNIFAENFILATGGKTYPGTGSTGAGYVWARDLGHSIIPPSPALSPIKTKGVLAQSLQGNSFKNVSISVFQDEKKKIEKRGEIIFTHFGLSGPAVLNISKSVGELLRVGETSIEIDFYPNYEFSDFDKKIQEWFRFNQNKDAKNYFESMVPEKLADILMKFAKIDPEKKVNLITRDERKKVSKILKGLRFNVDGLMDFNQAMVTAGGVSLKEVDPRTMRSRIIGNLFLAGEVLDLDGPTGGYNLQIAWTTGRIAGESAAERLS